MCGYRDRSLAVDLVLDKTYNNASVYTFADISVRLVIVLLVEWLFYTRYSDIIKEDIEGSSCFIQGRSTVLFYPYVNLEKQSGICFSNREPPFLFFYPTLS